MPSLWVTDMVTAGVASVIDFASVANGPPADADKTSDNIALDVIGGIERDDFADTSRWTVANGATLAVSSGIMTITQTIAEQGLATFDTQLVSGKAQTVYIQMLDDQSEAGVVVAGIYIRRLGGYQATATVEAPAIVTGANNIHWRFDYKVNGKIDFYVGGIRIFTDLTPLSPDLNISVQSESGVGSDARFQHFRLYKRIDSGDLFYDTGLPFDLLEPAAAGADVTKDSATVANLIRNIPPGIHVGGFGDLRFTKNTLEGGAANDGEIRAEGTKFYHPDGVTRTIAVVDGEISTPFEVTVVRNNTFYVVWTDEDPATRFPGHFVPSGMATNFFTAEYDWETGLWNALDNNQDEFTFTPLTTDCIVAVGFKSSTTGGIDTLSSLIGVNTDLPDDGATIGAKIGTDLLDSSGGSTSDDNLLNSNTSYGNYMGTDVHAGFLVNDNVFQAQSQLAPIADMGMVPGDDIHISVDLISGSGDSLQARLRFFNGGAFLSNLSGSGDGATNSTSWTRVHQATVIPANTTHIDVGFSNGAFGGRSGINQVGWRRAMITKGKVNVPYAPPTALLADVTGDDPVFIGLNSDVANLRKGLPPAIHKGGFGDLRFEKNVLNGGAANNGEVRVLGTKFYHPDGTTRTITNDKHAATNFEGNPGEGNTGVFYLIFTDTSPDVRFPGHGLDTSPDFFVAQYDWTTDTWNAVNNGSTTFAYTPIDSDCLVGVGFRDDTISTGITWFESLIGVNTNLPEDGADITGLNTALDTTNVDGLSASSILSGVAGSNIAANPEFGGASIGGYTVYNNSGGIAVQNTSAPDDQAPNTSGHVMRIDYDGIGPASPGFGGTVQSLSYAGAGNPAKPGRYVQNIRILFRIVAKIPVGRSIEHASNGTGFGGTWSWISTDLTGSGDWKTYVGIRTIGTDAASLGSTGHLYVQGGSNIAFSWYIARYDQIVLDASQSSFIGNMLRNNAGGQITETDLLNANTTAAQVGLGNVVDGATVNTGLFALLAGQLTAANISTYLAGLAVDTAQIANDAVTNGGAVKVASAMGTSGTAMATLNITTTGGDVLVMVTAAHSLPFVTAEWRFVIQRDGIEIAALDQVFSGATTQTIALSEIDTGASAAAHVYTVKAFPVSSSSIFKEITLFAIEFKK